MIARLRYSFYVLQYDVRTCCSPGALTPSLPRLCIHNQASKSCISALLVQTRGPPITPTSTPDIMLGHTSSHMLIARSCGPMKTLEEALGIVPVEGPPLGAFVHAHAVEMRALAWHTRPAHDGAAAPKLARPVVDKHLYSHTCLAHPRLRYRYPQVHGWGGGCGRR